MQRPSAPARRERLLLGLGAFGVCAHGVDHLVSDPEWGFLFTSAMLLAAATAGIASLYGWIPARLRVPAVLLLGAMWTATAGVHHVLGLLRGGPSPTDYTGVAAATGGVLILLAGADGLRARPRSGAVAPARETE